jgi:GxxExxY protein
LESSYEQCLAYELTQNHIDFLRQHPIAVVYKGIQLDCVYKIDLLVEAQLILEPKSVEAIVDIHRAQILTYMKFANFKTGLLKNFNVQLLKNEIERFVI